MSRNFGLLIVVGGLFSLLVGSVLVTAGLKGEAFTGAWEAHDCSLRLLEQRIRVRHDPLVMPRGGQVLLDTLVQFGWKVGNRSETGTWVELGTGANFDKLANLRQRLEIWSRVVSSEAAKGVSIWVDGNRWPAIESLEAWYQSLPSCDPTDGVDGVRCGSSSAYSPSPQANMDVTVEGSISLFESTRVHITNNKTIPCYAPLNCAPTCVVTLADPIKAKAQADHIIFTGLILIIAVTCLSSILQRVARKHVSACHDSVANFCSTIVTFTDNPEESTPLLRYKG